MNGKTNKMRRRLSIVGLAASIAAVAVSAASAGGNYQAAGLVAGKLGSPDPRETAQPNQIFAPSVVDRMLGSPDPRDSELLVLNVPSMDAVILREGRQQGSERFPRADDQTFRSIFQGAAQEHGAAGFGNTMDAGGVLRTTPIVVATDYSHLPTEDRP